MNEPNTRPPLDLARLNGILRCSYAESVWIKLYNENPNFKMCFEVLLELDGEIKKVDELKEYFKEQAEDASKVCRQLTAQLARQAGDSKRLDFLQTQNDKARYTGQCVFRLSTMGRGWRLHETSKIGFNSVRNAIDHAIAVLEKEKK